LAEEDSAWKEILEDLFEEFLDLFFPELHAAVDWSVRPEWLDKEFQALFPHEEGGGRTVDKLAKVRLQGGEEEWILVHVEVQGESRAGFNERMFRYNCLVRFRYQRDVVSLGVLTDEARSFRPGLYRRRTAGQLLHFRFPTVKLLDFEGRREELERSRNPFGLVVLAHLEAKRARGEEERFDARFRLARKLYQSGQSRENIRSLYRFLEWLLRLPFELEMALREKVQAEIEGKIAMPFLATFERVAMEKGREQGREEGLQTGRQLGRQEGREEGLAAGVQKGLRDAVRLVVRTRFGEAGLTLLPPLESIGDLERLRSLLGAVGSVDSVEKLSALLASL
jgi:hypothetical protein